MTDRPDPAAWIATRRELLDAATEGPWKWTTFHDSLLAGHESAAIVIEPPRRHHPAIRRTDAALIADARTSLPCALDALTAVLDLHRLNREDDGVCQGYTSSGYGYLDRWCVECSEQSGREYGTPYPCPTVAAVTGALS